MIYKFSTNKVEESNKEAVEMVGKFLGVYLLGPLIIMLAWNYVVPYLFAVKGINYLHAICIVFIAKFLQND